MKVIGRKKSLILSTISTAIAVLILVVGWSFFVPATARGEVTTEEFAREVQRVLPVEKSYDYHKRLSTEPVHIQRRNPIAKLQTGEMAIPDKGWKLVWNQKSSPILQTAVADVKDYMNTSMNVQINVEGRNSLDGWQDLKQCIVVGTRDQMPGYGAELKKPKDYEIVVTPEQIMVCGFDERGAMFGLYNLEERMNLREGPFLPADLKTVRHSLYDSRMILSWMGWMQWPDSLLSHLAHDGIDGIYASVTSNPNGDSTTASTSTSLYARALFRAHRQDPAETRDLINRAARYGIKVYTPIIYHYKGTPESEVGLRKLMRDILKDFPDIQGYILLTEGFWYDDWEKLFGASDEYLKNWAVHWTHAVKIVAEECHKVDPDIEVLPWEYNIDPRPQNVEMKRFFIQQLPSDTIPLLTWENGKSFEIDGKKGYLRDYSLNQIGPAEVAIEQIAESRKRGMKVYTKADSFATWQFGTSPYLPFPYQWHKRYEALEKFGVDGTLESWTTGYTPSFMTELRAWYCWTDAPPLEDLLTAIAARDFGVKEKEAVLGAWEHFSRAIQLMPDTGPNMGTNGAIGNPLFFEEGPIRSVSYKNSYLDSGIVTGYLGTNVNPHWPFTIHRLIFYPDFTNKTNKAEIYARNATGVEIGKEEKILPVFLKYLRLSSDEMEKGLKLYRAAALASPESKRHRAVREVVIAENIQRMIQSDHAILEFEDLRLKLAAEKDRQEKLAILDRMKTIVREEIARTELSLVATERDSRLGFQAEQDYTYTPYSLREKLESLHETLEIQLEDLSSELSNNQTDQPVK
jgi:hypothetical protein